MIKPVIESFKSGRSAIIGPVRLSYPHLTEPDNLTGKYGCSLIIPGGAPSAATVDALRRCIDETAEIGVALKWHGERPAVCTSPLEATDDGGHILKTSSKTAPVLSGVDGKPLDDPETMYGGCWVLASVGFAPYEYIGKKGVTCYVKGLRKVRDGERFGADARAALNAVDIDEYMVDDDDL